MVFIASADIYFWINSYICELKPKPNKGMSLIIKEVKSSSELRTFIDFPNKLYRGVPYYVPKFFLDEMSTLDPKENPAYEFSEAALYLAYRDGIVVGRVAAIVNRKANESWNHKEVRFGWIDFIDDYEVSEALINKVVEFGKARGMDKIVGPLGFTDFDPEGMLVEGFNQMCTMVLIYNYPYYPVHFERLGFVKEIDWLEYKVFLPAEIPDKIKKLAEIVPERYGVRVKKPTRKEVKAGLGYKIFDLVNETYSSLYNFTVLPKKMIDKYVGFYLGLIDLEYVTLVVDKDENVIGFGLSMPSLAKALQKSGGKLFPFGWYHLLKAAFWKHDDTIEMLLVGVKPEYQNKGILAMIYSDLIPRYRKGGFKYGESNAELETNLKVQSPWEHFEYEQKKRRRIVMKRI